MTTGKNKRKNDIMIFGILILTALVLLGFRSFFTKEGGTAIVTVNGTEFGSYDLQENQTIDIHMTKGSDGRVCENTVIIEDGEVHMGSANCPDRLCVKQGSVTKVGESIICLPNRVVVTIQGGEEGAYDGISQ